MAAQMPPDHETRLYDALIATHPDVQRKGKSNPHTAVNLPPDAPLRLS